MQSWVRPWDAVLKSRWVQTQQSAEMWAILQGDELASHMGIRAIHIAPDNLSAIWSAIRLTGAIDIPCCGKLPRRLAHQVRRTKIQVYLNSVPSKSNLADAPSRLYEYPDLVTTPAGACTTHLVASSKPNNDPMAMGWLGSSGSSGGGAIAGKGPGPSPTPNAIACRL